MIQPEITKFLLCPDQETEQLYILHRHFPACLIWIKQTCPVTFVLLDLYDQVENENDILTLPFIQDAKDFYNNFVKSTLDFN